MCYFDITKKGILKEVIMGFSSFKYAEIPRTVKIIEKIAPTGSAPKKIYIPESVVAISKEAFENCPIMKIVIPESVIEIGDRAFSVCRNLCEIIVDEDNPKYMDIDGILYNKECTELISCPSEKFGLITIPESVIIIRDDAFYDCEKLTAITIPKNVTSIGKEAFYGCKKLTAITIPKNVVSIGDRAFSNCYKLASIDVLSGNKYFSSDNGILYNKELTELIFCPKNYSGSINIPNSLKCIESKAFENCGNLTDITIGNGVTSMVDGAFDGCESLTKITIGNSVISIGQYCFRYCKNLSEIFVEHDNPKYTAIDGVLYDKNLTELIFCPKNKSGSINIPDSVKSIKYRELQNCENISEIFVGAKNSEYKDIDGVLYNKNGTELLVCPKKKSGFINLPNSLKSVEDPYKTHIFHENENLSEIFVGADNEKYTAVDGVLYDKKVTELIFCPKRKSGSIVISNSVTKIIDHRLIDCKNLSEIIVEDDNLKYKSIDGVLYNKEVTELIICPKGKLGSIIIPNSVTIIRDFWIRECINLSEIIVEDDNLKYKSIDGVLYNKEVTELIICPRGKSGFVNVPDSVKIIKQEAFQNCKKLTGITLGNAITRFSGSIFWGCESLTRITIGDSVTYIEHISTLNGENLRELFIGDNNPYYKAVDGVLYNKDVTKLITCPLRKPEPVTIPESVTSIENFAFSKCEILTSITIPDSVKIIKNGAFQHCKRLSKMTIGNGVTTIESDVFSGCKNLSEIFVADDNPNYKSKDGVLLNKEGTVLIFSP